MSQNFTAYNIIQKKRDKGKLTTDEIKWFITGLTEGSIADYQMSALLMAIYLNGMDKEETRALTDAMLYSGRVLDFKERHFIDKHSTGGVGDKTSFILAPIARACGVMVPMIAGRGLGHTGGTVDKIEAVKGFKTEISLDDFQKGMKERGLVLIGQTKEIAPADKKIYALRDVTATVESIPLITASIMSKKLAEGASGIVMDVKTGDGAFMKESKKAKLLAQSILETGVRFKKNMMTMITDMNQPLGLMIGNSLEIIESVETLKGKGPKDLTELSLSLAGGMIYLAGLAKSHAEGIKKATVVLENGEALKYFREMIIAQGGDPSFIDDYSKLPTAEKTIDIKATKAGFVSKISCKEMGLHCVKLGGGRMKAEDKIDFAVGFVLNKKIGDAVKKGETLLTVHYRPKQDSLVEEIAKSILTKDIEIKKTKPTKKKLIQEVKVKIVRK
ncbi:MAG: thymidine phosphorylase [Bacteriovoracaceae bacterium]|nr:thymidine phosphorylase [Bacteriovoracaceae bacterium]